MNKLKHYIFLVFAILTVVNGAFGQGLTIQSVVKTNETCNYSNDGTITISVTGGLKPYKYYIIGGSIFESLSTNDTVYTFTGLPARNYSVTVEDDTSIVVSPGIVNLTQPAVLVISSEIVTAVNCNSADDGTITVAASGGNGGYIYTLNPGAISNGSGFFNGLSPGTYTVSVIDSKGCGPVVSNNLVITEPVALTLSSLVFTNITCNGNNNGTITLSMSGGNLPLTFTLIPGGTTNNTGVFPSLPANTYTINVVDSKGCPGYTSAPVTILNPPVISILSQSSTNVTCNGLNNGTISVTGTGGTGTLNYTIAPGGTNNTTGNFTNLSPQTYTVSVTDANACPVATTTPIVITEPTPIVINTQTSTNITCFASNNGTVNVTASGGTGILQYTLNPGAITNTTGTFINLSNGTYTVSVTDANNCSPVVTGSLIITRPPVISLVSSTSTNITCHDSNNGLINVTGAGGTPPLTYTLTPGGTINGTGSFSSLAQGVYTVEIKDANACPSITTPPITITNPAAITISSQNSTNITCSGLTNGTITIIATGGTGSKHYTIAPGGTTNTTGLFTGLAAAVYTVSVTDDNACPAAVSTPITITAPGPIVINTQTSTNITCFASNNGTVNVTASGGTGILQYTLNPGAITNTTGTFINLSNGTYTVSVTDANNCAPVVTGSLIITRPPVISLVSSTSTNITCHDSNNGLINVTGAGGTPPLTYTLTPGGTINGTGSFNSLAQGVYTVEIKDANACPSITTPPITITNPAAITISSQNSTNIECNGQTNGTITIVATGGTGLRHYTIAPGGTTNTTGLFTGLPAGIYTVSVTDDNACPATVSTPITITEPGIIAVSIDGTSVLTLNCFGNTNGRIDITVTGGTAPFVYSWTGPSGYTAATQDISSLLPGVYSLSITDSKSCSNNFPALATVTEPPQLDFSFVKTDITCNGMANGSVTITASGGTPPYTYSKNGIIYQASPIFSGLTTNTYTFYTKDFKNCLVSKVVTITEPFALQITSEIRVDNNMCFGDSLGEINILNVTGGLTPYQYSINGGATYFATSLFQNLPAGNYQTVVKDANGCTDNGNLNVINQPAKITINSYAQLDITGCFDSPNGQIAIEATGGTGTKTYTLDGTISNSTGIFINLTGGIHTINITDINSCYKDTTVTLTRPVQLGFATFTQTNVTGCSGDSNGSIIVTGTGGTGPYEYSLNALPYQVSGNFGTLLAGNYTVTIKDSNDCLYDTLVIITEPVAISISGSTITNVSCGGLSDGSITISTIGGTAPYTYTLNPGAVSTNNSGVFIGLSSGNYTVDIDDINGCGIVTSTVLAVTEPAALILDSLVSEGISCSGSNDAEIHIYASGGTSPYNYSIDNEATYGINKDFTGLLPGTYHVSLNDDNNCKVYIDTLTFVNPALIVTVSESKVDIVTCSDDSSGSVSFVVSGGTGTMEYSIDLTTWQASGNFTGLTSGSYQVTARDDNSCTLVSSVLNISAPPAITATITSTPYMDAFTKGTITISGATGGTGTLAYSITGVGGTFSSVTTYNNLDPATYNLVVRDANGCTFQQDIVILSTPSLDVTISFENPYCNGANDGSITLSATNGTGIVQYSIDDSATWSSNGQFDSISAGTYYIFAKDEDLRIFRDTLTLTEPVAINIISLVTPASCSSLSGDGAIDITIVGGTGTKTYLWSTGDVTQDITEVDAGDYTVDVTDQNACSTSRTITVNGLTTVIADAGRDTSLCLGEGIIFDGSGGTTYSWTPVTGLSNPNIPNPVVIIDSNINYVLTVVGLNSCFDTDTLNITVRPLLEVHAGSDTAVEKNSTITLQASGDTFVNYSWFPVTGLTNPNSASTQATPLITTPFILSAVDSFGCTAKDTVLIKIVDRLIIYNVFSPNDDGINDFWDIDNTEVYPDILVEVFSRWGSKLFSSKGYSNDKRWDGTFKGKFVPIGTYYYVVIPKKGATPLTGPLTIVR